ncbi:hypothetical protein KTQ42_19620 [Noviherbaspirillum sp. L7-7A]|uniref:hypothetical protein n=1 Tax=Noviherbaspirillum sp. L7-7A TaxID=2850560 RepID=UPI001C2BFB78|nr:hypothetical protein [Noviherbaspirillum sp. L7-7A]MBV0881500.1 hypothetical protein [Noviherbaspirillum sp. L7-7A]
MTNKKPITRPTETTINSYIKKQSELFENQKSPGSHGHHASESVREAEYNGHRIVIKTTYQIEVDGEPISGHLAVTNDGQVHYHPIPNLSFASAIDLVKQLVDVFPDDFENDHSSPEHHHGHMPAKSSEQPKRDGSSKPKKHDVNGNGK